MPPLKENAGHRTIYFCKKCDRAWQLSSNSTDQDKVMCKRCNKNVFFAKRCLIYYERPVMGDEDKLCPIHGEHDRKPYYIVTEGDKL